MKSDGVGLGIGRRGLSPVIASVLLILLVLVLAIIVFLWSRGFIGEQVEKFGKPIEEYCGRAEFEVSVYSNELEILNFGDVDIKSFEIKKVRGGNSETADFAFKVDAGDTVRGHITLEMDGNMPEKIILYPVLVGSIRGAGSNSLFACMDDGTEVVI